MYLGVSRLNLWKVKSVVQVPDSVSQSLPDFLTWMVRTHTDTHTSWAEHVWDIFTFPCTPLTYPCFCLCKWHNRLPAHIARSQNPLSCRAHPTASLVIPPLKLCQVYLHSTLHGLIGISPSLANVVVTGGPVLQCCHWPQTSRAAMPFLCLLTDSFSWIFPTFSYFTYLCSEQNCKDPEDRNVVPLPCTPKSNSILFSLSA